MDVRVAIAAERGRGAAAATTAAIGFDCCCCCLSSFSQAHRLIVARVLPASTLTSSIQSCLSVSPRCPRVDHRPRRWQLPWARLDLGDVSECMFMMYGCMSMLIYLHLDLYTHGCDTALKGQRLSSCAPDRREGQGRIVPSKSKWRWVMMAPRSGQNSCGSIATLAAASVSCMPARLPACFSLVGASALALLVRLGLNQRQQLLRLRVCKWQRRRLGARPARHAAPRR